LEYTEELNDCTWNQNTEELNDCAWNQKQVNPTQIMSMSQTMLTEWQSVQNYAGNNMEDCSRFSGRHSRVHAEFHCAVDANFFRNNGLMGYGCCLLNRASQFVKVLADWSRPELRVPEGEATALQNAMR